MEERNVSGTEYNFLAEDEDRAAISSSATASASSSRSEEEKEEETVASVRTRAARCFLGMEEEMWSCGRRWWKWK